MPAILPGWRRYRCSSCRYQRELFGAGVDPDLCSCCGKPWQAVSATVGPARPSLAVLPFEDFNAAE
jgi:hypothetical protein